MCGIFGSTRLEQFKTLYAINKQRGDFAYGGVYVSSAGSVIHKVPGEPNMEHGANSDYYLGHTQAPTSVEREHSVDTSHPFQHNDWVVAHNGVLSNDRDIIQEYWMGSPPDTVNNVDSSVIPAFIDHCYIGEDSDENEIKAITCALGALKGTFGVWIYNENSDNKYLARVGSTLFRDARDNHFSSIQDPYHTLVPLKEGVLYKITDTIDPVGKFEYSSPFFVL